MQPDFGAKGEFAFENYVRDPLVFFFFFGWILLNNFPIFANDDVTLQILLVLQEEDYEFIIVIVTFID